MEQNEVKIIHIQFFQRVFHCLSGVFIGTEIHLCGDEQVAPGNAAFHKGPPYGLLIAVSLRCVDQAVACPDCFQNTAFALRPAHQERAKAQDGHFNTIV